MGRPRIPAGEFGPIQITKLAKGKVRARARDDAGVLHKIVAVATTEEAARIDLRRKVEALSTSSFLGLTGANTIAEASVS